MALRHLVLLALACSSIAGLSSQIATPTLVGFASLPANSFAPGPTSGQFIAAANGVTPPFPNRQPIQGFSSVLRTSNGEFFAMPDNGFGSKPTSPDYVLRLYRVAPDFRTATGGSGSVLVETTRSCCGSTSSTCWPIDSRDAAGTTPSTSPAMPSAI